MTKQHHNEVLQCCRDALALQHFTHIQVGYNLPLSKVCRRIHGKIISSVTAVNIVQHILKDGLRHLKQLRRL